MMLRTLIRHGPQTTQLGHMYVDAQCFSFIVILIIIVGVGFIIIGKMDALGTGLLL